VKAMRTNDRLSWFETVTAGISTSTLLETALLRFGADKLPWNFALQTACGMSLVSMLAMELTENAVTLGFLAGESGMMMSGPGDARFWGVMALSMLAGWLAPLPWNYFRLRRWGRGCH